MPTFHVNTYNFEEKNLVNAKGIEKKTKEKQIYKTNKRKPHSRLTLVLNEILYSRKCANVLC